MDRGRDRHSPHATYVSRAFPRRLFHASTLRYVFRSLARQAGQQMEYVTGGHVRAGYHEVVVDEAARAAAARVKAEGGSLWRVSTTMFGTVRSDATLAPFPRFASEPAAKEGKYPPLKAGQQVLNELLAIGMADELQK